MPFGKLPYGWVGICISGQGCSVHDFIIIPGYVQEPHKLKSKKDREVLTIPGFTIVIG